MLYTNGRIATPRGRQYCPDCRPDAPCAAHPFEPGVDRWTHNPRPWPEPEEIQAECAECLGTCEECENEPLVAIYVHPGTGRASLFVLKRL